MRGGGAPLILAALAVFMLGVWPGCGSDSDKGDAVDQEVVDGGAWHPDDTSPSKPDGGGGGGGEVALPVSQRLLLTRRGSHSYLLFPDLATSGSEPSSSTGGPRLFWRQYSDVLSHLGVFTPLLKPLVELQAIDSCTLQNYGWNASHVVREYQCGDLKVIETTAYVEADVIGVRYRVINDGEDSAIALDGQAAGAGITPTISHDSALPGFHVSIDGTYMNFWGDDTAAKWRFAVSSVPEATSSDTSEDGRTWTLNYAIAAGEKLDIVLTVTLGEDSELSKAPLDPQSLYEPVNALDEEMAEWLALAPDPALLSSHTYMNSWYLFWENTSSPRGNWSADAITPSKRHYFRGVWLWDAAFHAVALAQGGKPAVALGRKQIDLFINQPEPDGHMSRELWVADANPGTQPPGLMTWASLLVTAKMKEQLEEEETLPNYFDSDYPVFKANHEWFYSQLDSDGDGLCEWEGTDSGWDTSPRWDFGPVEALDLACWLYLDATLLASMAMKLAKVGEANAWTEEAELLGETIRTKFWDQTAGFFFDLAIENNQYVPVRTPATFLPLFVGAATQEQAETVAAHLSDPNTFATPYLLPSVAATDTTYKSSNYWRGPVWIVLNAFTIWGLDRYGLTAEAKALRKQTLSLIEGEETTYEYYDSQTGEGLGAPDFMWTAAFYVLLKGEDPTIW